jgi:integrase
MASIGNDPNGHRRILFVAADGSRKAIRLGKCSERDADAFRAHLLSEKRARATVAKWCQYARHFFEVAKRRRIIADNPFAHIKESVRGNPARRVFIPPDHARRIIDIAPDPQWKLLIALARWGGLRIPSEALALTWSDVDFEHGRFTVRSSKTERHEGGGVRVVPMFPELVEHFQRVFDEAEPGTEHIITRYRDPTANLRTQLIRYITAAGLTPWPKPWQNMRSTRATELADLFPSHVSAAWLGHTEAIADEFYRQVTDEHFHRAMAGDGSDPEKAARKAARIPAQQLHAGYRTTSQPTPEMAICEQKRGVATGCISEMGAAGFEPATKGL